MAVSADLIGPPVLPFKERNQDPVASYLTDDARRLSEVVKKSPSTGNTIWVCGGRTREAEVPCLDGFVDRNKLSELKLRPQSPPRGCLAAWSSTQSWAESHQGRLPGPHSALQTEAVAFERELRKFQIELSQFSSFPPLSVCLQCRRPGFNP